MTDNGKDNGKEDPLAVKSFKEGIMKRLVGSRCKKMGIESLDTLLVCYRFHFTSYMLVGNLTFIVCRILECCNVLKRRKRVETTREMIGQILNLIYKSCSK